MTTTLVEQRPLLIEAHPLPETREAIQPPILVPHRYDFASLPEQEDSEGTLRKMSRLFASTLNDWKTILSDRIGSIRVAMQREGCDREKLRQDLEDDLHMQKNYFLLISMCKENLRTPPPPTRKIIALTDEHRLIQGFCDCELLETSERVKFVFIHTLFTAPWNLRIHAPVPETHAHMVRPGVGLSLFRHVYSSAQVLGAEYVRLRPNSNSVSFYRDRLRMGSVPDEKGGIVFSMPVQPSLPRELLER